MQVRDHIAQAASLLELAKEELSSRLNMHYPVGMVLGVRLKHGQTTPTRATVFVESKGWSSRAGCVRVRLEPSRRKPDGLTRDIYYTDILCIFEGAPPDNHSPSGLYSAANAAWAGAPSASGEDAS